MWPGKIRPEKFIESYNVSKQQTLQRKYGPVLLNSSIYLNIWRKKFLKVEDDLRARRELYKQERKDLLKKWQEIEQKGDEIQKNFVNFNSFLTTNIQKRKRAQYSLEHNRSLVKQHDEGITELTKNIETIQGTIRELEEGIHKHKIYEKYLHEVVDKADREDNFKHVDNIVERYEYCTEIAISLLQKQEKAFDILQNIKIEWSKCEEVNANVILGLHTQLAGLQGRYDLATEKTRQLENLIKQIKDVTCNNFADVQITKAAILNLYRLICRARNIVPKIPKDDVENQLFFISKSLKQYEYINEEMNKIMKKNPKKINKQQ